MFSGAKSSKKWSQSLDFQDLFDAFWGDSGWFRKFLGQISSGWQPWRMIGWLDRPVWRKIYCAWRDDITVLQLRRVAKIGQIYPNLDSISFLHVSFNSPMLTISLQQIVCNLHHFYKRFTINPGWFWHCAPPRHRISSSPIEEELGGGGVGLRHDVVHLPAAACAMPWGHGRPMAPTTAWRGHWQRDMKIWWTYFYMY